ncbi:hypothetical protein Nmel_003951, partial [Mimus melanotis]
MPLALQQPLVGDCVSILLFIEQYMAKSAREENHGFTKGLLRSPYRNVFELLAKVILPAFKMLTFLEECLQALTKRCHMSPCHVP